MWSGVVHVVMYCSLFSYFIYFVHRMEKKYLWHLYDSCHVNRISYVFLEYVSHTIHPCRNEHWLNFSLQFSCPQVKHRKNHQQFFFSCFISSLVLQVDLKGKLSNRFKVFFFYPIEIFLINCALFICVGLSDTIFQQYSVVLMFFLIFIRELVLAKVMLN